MASLTRQAAALFRFSSSSSLQKGVARYAVHLPVLMFARSLCAPAEELGFECDGLHNHVKALERENALRQALSRVSGDLSKEPMLRLRRFFSSRRQPVISTGSLRLDSALGIGGLPRGRIVEIYGKEASGKTTLALHIIKEAQKLGGCCAYFDVENTMDPSLMEAMGIDTENLLFLRPSSAENLLSAVDTLTKCGSVDVIVVDSVAALIPQCEIDNPVSSNERDMQSVIMTQALRKIHSSLSQSRAVIIFVNQVRHGHKYGQNNYHLEEVTCGGNALKFYAAIRLRLVRLALMKTEDKVNGLGICVEVVKNKLAPTMSKTELGIVFGKGLYIASEVLDLACEHGIIVREGTCYYIHGKIFHDKQEAEMYLVRHEEILQKIVMTLRELLFDGVLGDP
ncbi:hypothetical protein MLD38_031016 [Melastoma candidum]|uniref:Uncharacterized protein n=1 Tax=Melastoma candidum TaxID=119954 RepID=A0ACB9MNF2_9MYRT|nr:hypothetical protein MLD38_031016 [Melastoma candidum]